MINTDLVKGDNISFPDSVIVHPSHTDSRTHSGDAVVIGRLAGVAASSATLSTDLITVVFRGVFNIPVVPGAAPISIGETVYIHPSTAVVGSDLTGTPFGVALDAASASGTIRVKLFGQTPGAIGSGS